MGAYLSQPVTEKYSTDETLPHVSYGASSMQGWRTTQEVRIMGNGTFLCFFFDIVVRLKLTI